MTRCSYQEGMNADEEPELMLDGPTLRVRGEVAAIANHEAGHSVLKFALGVQQGALSVTTIYHRGPYGTYAVNTGVSEPWREPGEIICPATQKGKLPVSLNVANPFACWKPFLLSAMIATAGHAAQRKYCASQGLPIRAGSEGDREACELEARRCWACAGRNGEALLRHAWARTQHLLEIPEVWKAVEAVEAALFSGLLWKEWPNPRPGDSVEFVIEGHEVEALIEGTGLRFGAHWNNHKCGPECVRSRPISKRFRAVVQSWASESSTSHSNKELENAT
jgi:hypothetical protein